MLKLLRKGVRVADGVGLENRCEQSPWVRIPPLPRKIKINLLLMLGEAFAICSVNSGGTPVKDEDFVEATTICLEFCSKLVVSDLYNSRYSEIIPPY